MAKRRVQPGDAAIAVAYLRVSTDKQENGPEAQRATIEAWGARGGIRLAAWHADQGVSGASELADRPALATALGELRVLGAGHLVVAKRDRLARDVYVAITIERAIEACGARVTSADGTGNGAEPADQFMRTILDAAAEYERALIRARTKAALAARRAHGLPAGPAPYGYRAVATGATNVRGRPATRLELHPDEQAVIARALELARRGASQREIATTLEGEGVRSRAGEPLSQVQVYRILVTARGCASLAPTEG